MKRFTETEKWRDPWFQKLDSQSRTLWLWLCDRVDNAGVIDICWPICNAETSGSFSEETMKDFGDRVEKLDNGKWWIPKFTEFQVGGLSENCKPHVYIINLLKKHSLYDRVLHKVCNTFKEKEQEKDKDKEQEFHPVNLSYPKKGKFTIPTLTEIRHEFKMLEVPESEAEKFLNHYAARDWMMGSSKMGNLTYACRSWKDKMKEIAKPQEKKPAPLRILKNL